MVIFGIESEKNITPFMMEFKKNLEEVNILKNPFKGVVLFRKNLYIIDIKPLYPPIGFFAGIAIVIFNGLRLNFWLFLSLVLLLSGGFYTKYLPFLAIVCGLKKKGYKGKIKLLTTNKLLEALLYGPTTSIWVPKRTKRKRQP